MRAAVLLLLLAACAIAPSTAVESAYTAELLRCVDKSKTVQESHACRQTVDAAFAVDGGAK